MLGPGIPCEPVGSKERRLPVEALGVVKQEARQSHHRAHLPHHLRVFALRDTGEVVRQFPEDMILKLKAYARQMARKEQDDAETEHRVEKVA